MSEVVTSAHIAERMDRARVGANEAADALKVANEALTPLETAFDDRYNQAFIDYKEAGCTDPLATAKAKIDSREEKQALAEAKRDKSTAASIFYMWEHEMKAISALSYTVNSELKLARLES